MSTKSPHILARREQALDQKEQIINLLKWSEEFYCEHQYNCGVAYLNYYIPTDPIGMEFLVRSKTFWNWWKNKWADRDREFLDRWLPGNHYRKVQLGTLVQLYLEEHDPLELSMGVKPHAAVLDSSYAVMFQDVIDNEIVLKSQKVR